ncbi:glycosyltransferase family 4 protein [Miniphocaeibacter massiliensis]|uniref:glycosyltransferase family 4 protein n=1 Tax=Miniphocaeibacter massiliensis TaxID=2041841 RepID=UPI000C071D2F|nr:glycosyltransferase family 4 protein [Miniphocaeibacter massiliensis]
MKNLKNIWIINHYADPPNIGKFTRHYNFAKHLIDRGYNVKIFTASTIHTTSINMITNDSKYKVDNYNGVEYVFVKTSTYQNSDYKRILNILEYYLRVPKVTKNFVKPDLILASSPHPLTWMAANKIAKRTGAKFITETRDLWPETFVAMGKVGRKNIISKILYSIERKMYRKADRNIFTIPGGIDYIRDRNLNTSKVDYINNGIDLKTFYENVANSKYVDKDLSDKNAFKLVFTGAIGRANDLGITIKAFEILKNSNCDNIKFLIFGDSGEKEELEKYCKTKGLDNVIFKGRVNKNEVPSILTQSDLQLLSVANLPELYKYGMSPNKLFEYMAAGKPVLSNQSCGYDPIELYDFGKVASSNTSEAIAESLTYFYNLYREDKNKYDQYCTNALNAAKDFDFSVLTDRLEESFKKIK